MALRDLPFQAAGGQPAFDPATLERFVAAPRVGVLAYTRRDGRLTPERVLAAVGSHVDDLSVFMCGPKAMLRSFRLALRGAGVRPWRIHHEYFDWR